MYSEQQNIINNSIGDNEDITLTDTNWKPVPPASYPYALYNLIKISLPITLAMMVGTIQQMVDMYYAGKLSD